MSVTDEILAALNAGVNMQATVRALLPLCPSAENTTDIAKACLGLVRSGLLARDGTPGKYFYRIPGPTERALVDALTAAGLKPPKPGVGKNPGSAALDGSFGSENSSTKGNAVAKKTPPEPEVSGTSPAGRDVRTELPLLSINQDGELTVGDATDPARWVFTPAQTLALGDFLRLTEPLWRQ